MDLRGHGCDCNLYNRAWGRQWFFEPEILQLLMPRRVVGFSLIMQNSADGLETAGNKELWEELTTLLRIVLISCTFYITSLDRALLRISNYLFVHSFASSQVTFHSIISCTLSPFCQKNTFLFLDPANTCYCIAYVWSTVPLDSSIDRSWLFNFHAFCFTWPQCPNFLTSGFPC
jgi:hypothetical protein